MYSQREGGVMYLSPPVWFACTLTATCIGLYMCHNFNTIFHQRILQSEGMKLIQDTARFAQYCRWDDDIVQDGSVEISIMNLFTMEARFSSSLSHLPKNWIIFLRDTLIKKTDQDFVVNMLQFKQCVERYFHHESSISSRAEVADRSSWSNSAEVYRSTIQGIGRYERNEM